MINITRIYILCNYTVVLFKNKQSFYNYCTPLKVKIPKSWHVRIIIYSMLSEVLQLDLSIRKCYLSISSTVVLKIKIKMHLKKQII